MCMLVSFVFIAIRFHYWEIQNFEWYMSYAKSKKYWNFHKFVNWKISIVNYIDKLFYEIKNLHSMINQIESSEWLYTWLLIANSIYTIHISSHFYHIINDVSISYVQISYQYSLALFIIGIYFLNIDLQFQS